MPVCNDGPEPSLHFSICNFQFALSSLFAPGPLLLALSRSERLREPKLNLALVQTIDRRERSIVVQSLGDQKLRRIQKVSEINRQRAAEWRLDAGAYAQGIRPTLSQVLGIDVFQKISRAHDRFRMEDVAGVAKHIAAVIERHDL